jgi:hypothetical protein
MRETLCKKVNGCIDTEGGKRLRWAGEVNEDPAIRGSKRKLGAEGSNGIAAGSTTMRDSCTRELHSSTLQIQHNESNQATKRGHLLPCMTVFLVNSRSKMLLVSVAFRDSVA